MVTALNANGETTGSAEISATTTGSTGSVALAWTAVTGATSYKVYRGTSAGLESIFYTTATASYTDIGGASTVGTVPTVNTTSGATTGFDITFNDVTSDAGTRYQIWYSASVLSVWKDGTLEYSNVVNASVDTATTDMTRCLCSAAQKTPRARGRTRPDPAGPGCAATSRNATILPHFQLDRNIPSRAKRHGKAGELPCFSGRQEFSGDFPPPGRIGLI